MPNDDTLSLAAPTPANARQSHKTDSSVTPPVSNQAEDIAWKFPTPEEIREELSAEFTKDQKETAWMEAAEAVKIYHDGLVRRWKEEMDTLLVYAGLFSAVLTAFNVQSYQLLQPVSTDSTVALLREISAQLGSFTVSPPFVNCTRQGTIFTGNSIQPPPFRAPTSAVWLNTLWFSSLVFSLASASIALLVKQWLHEATVQGTSRDSARLRQYRLNGLVKWRIGTIVALLPILLQVASVLFLAGIMVLLWTLHAAVAAITSSLIAALFAFFFAVTFLPVFTSGCAYRSPASFAVFATYRRVWNATMRTARRICQVVIRWHTALACGVPRVTGLHRFAHRRRYLSTWRGRDQNDIYKQLGALDRAIVTTAYSTTADTKFVSEMPVVFSDLPPDQVPQCFVDICNFMEGEWGDRGIQQRLLEDRATLSSLTCYGLRHMLARTDKDTEAWSDDIYTVYQYFCLGDDMPSKRFAELACKTLCQLAVEYPPHIAVYDSACLVLRDVYDRLGACHSYDTLCHARAMLERELESWDPSRGFKGLQSHTAAIYVLLHCLRETISGRSQLTPTQTDAMLAWGQDTLSRAVQWLRDLEWQGLHNGCLAVLGDAAGVVVFPHIASSHLIMDIIDPLLALSSTPGGLTLISGELISVVENAWSSAQAAYPNPIDIIQGAGLVWCSGLDTIDMKLLELRATISGHPNKYD